MKRSSVSDAKNSLSALIECVRHGESVIIEDRGVPVARLDPVLDVRLDDEGRMARLERAGIARRPTGDRLPAILRSAPPRPSGKVTLSATLLAERADGR